MKPFARAHTQHTRANARDHAQTQHNHAHAHGGGHARASAHAGGHANQDQHALAHAQPIHDHAQHTRANARDLAQAQHTHAHAQAHARAFTMRAILALLMIAMPTVASSHSASDAYLTLTTDGSVSGEPLVIHGQWDIALRDLDFVLELDDGDGQLTWGEVRKHRAAIESYAYRHLEFDGGDGNACTIKPQRQMIDDHADGAYAALFFDVVCAHRAQELALGYTLFFKVDPSHRGIFVMHSGANVATALLSPENARIDLRP